MRKTLGALGHHLFGLRFQLLLLVAAACAPLIILTLRNASEDRRKQVANWRQRTQRAAHTAVLEEERIIGDTKQVLLALAETYAVRNGNARACKRLMDKESATYPRYANLGVIKTNGDVLASAQTRADMTAEDREFFQKVLQTRAFTIGGFPNGRIGGKPTVNFGYPVLNSAGEAQGVVFAALDVNMSGRLGSELPSQLPKEATWVEVDRNGIILFRYPARPGWIGQPLPERSLLNADLKNEQGVVATWKPDGNS